MMGTPNTQEEIADYQHLPHRGCNSYDNPEMAVAIRIVKIKPDFMRVF